MLMWMVIQDRQGNMNDDPGVAWLSNCHKKEGFQFRLIYIGDFLKDLL